MARRNTTERPLDRQGGGALVRWAVVLSLCAAPANQPLGANDYCTLGELPRAPFSVSQLSGAIVQVVSDDFDRDGYEDLAGVAPLSHVAIVLLNTGDGSFIERQVINVRDAFAIACEDVNGDSIPDLAIACALSNHVRITHGDGMGTFGPAQQLGYPFALPQALAFKDLNNDDRVELLVGTSGDSSLHILKSGVGIRDYEVVSSLRCAGRPLRIAFGRYDDDNEVDLFVGASGPGMVYVFRQESPLQFALIDSLFVDNAPSGLEVLDVTGDGRDDVIATATDINAVSVFVRLPAGGYASRQAFPTGVAPGPVCVVDLDSSGLLDFVTSSRLSGRVDVLLDSMSEVHQSAYSVVAGIRPGALVCRDFDGDSRLDLVWATGDVLAQATQMPGGGFEPGISITFPSPPSALDVGECDGNPATEDIVVARSTGELELFGGGEGVVLGPSSLIAEDLQATQLWTMDITGDGLDDILCIEPGKQRLRLYKNLGVSTFVTLPDVALGTGITRGEVADIDGDGDADFAGCSESFGKVELYYNDGIGHLKHYASVECPGGPTDVKVLDINQDGLQDLVVVCNWSGVLRTFLGSANGFAGESPVSPVSGAPKHCMAGDLSSDGIPDVVVSDAVGGFVTVLLGNTTGTFTHPVTYPVMVFPSGIQVGDFTGDGFEDVVIGSARASCLSILQGAGDGTFCPPRTLGTGSGPYLVATGDVNGDSKPDLVTGNSLSRGLSIVPGSNVATPVAPLTFRAVAFDDLISITITVRGVDGLSLLAIDRIAGDDPPREVWSTRIDQRTQFMVTDQPHSQLGVSYQVRLFDRNGSITYWGPYGVDQGTRLGLTRVSGVFPNPMVGKSALWIDAPSPLECEVTVFDISGRRVRGLFLGILDAGRTRIDWDGVSDSGSQAPKGVFFIRVSFSGDRSVSRRLVRF